MPPNACSVFPILYIKNYVPSLQKQSIQEPDKIGPVIATPLNYKESWFFVLILLQAYLELSTDSH